MPARRFFALAKAKNKLECMAAIDRIDEALVSSHNVNIKWYEGLRSKWIGRLGPQELPPEPPKRFQTDEEMKQTQATVLELFRQRKQLEGYGR
jgi:hypothetical protein